MGVMNQRAICPNCGGKLHTQPRGLGKITLARSGPLVQTGTECQWCHTALTGRVGLNNQAIAADDPRAHKLHAKGDLDQRLMDLVEQGPITLGEAMQELGASRNQVAAAQNRLRPHIKARGLGLRRTFTPR